MIKEKAMLNIWINKPLGDNEAYNDGQNINKPELEEFVINNGKKHSCVLILPGGGYDHLANHEGANVAKKLNEKGISAFVLYYRVAPYAHPVQLWDSKRAMRYIRYNADKYNIYADKIGIMGFSAGAHLAGLTAEFYDKYDHEATDDIDAVSAKPDALCLCYPVVSLTKPISHFRSGDNLCRGSEDIKIDFSLENSVREDMPPTFIWHTVGDKSVDCRNSLEMASALKEKNCVFELHIFPDGKHGSDLAEGIKGTEQWFSLYCNWLERIGF